jgi:hypothetical protein
MNAKKVGKAMTKSFELVRVDLETVLTTNNEVTVEIRATGELRSSRRARICRICCVFDGIDVSICLVVG